MKTQNWTLGLMMTGALALSACKSEAPKTETQPAAAASQPASQPAVAPTATATKTSTVGAVDREQVDKDGTIRRGPALSQNKAITVTDAYAGVDKLVGQTVKLTGKVEKVCEAMGCWLTVKGDKPDQFVKVNAKDHSWMVPTSIVGRIATVEGTLSLAEPAEGDCSGDHAEHGKKPAKELAIDATSVEIVAANS
ncbi:DUF4920 domain-containing protein [Myxococcota bacterium]|nr:DUF4920 domain-containing protein [Myxococcota bacterium]